MCTMSDRHTQRRPIERPSADRPKETDFSAAGFVILSGGLPSHKLTVLRDASDALQNAHSRPRAGIRDPLSASPAFARVERQIRPLAEALIGKQLSPVRSILFDKTPETNWDVVWHQDVTIALRERRDVDGFGPWSIKQAVTHVQPPAAVLESMITLRLHLDDCPSENGPLLVVPGSHLDGFVDVRALDTAKCEEDAFACVVSAGNVLATRPLLLHASKKASAPSHRRVLHVEYASEPLPDGLEWAT